MIRSEASDTTSPAQSTGTGHEEATAEVIRWVFPESFARMTPLDGAVLPRALGRLTPLDATPLVLGRADDCDVQLTGTEISRRHAKIARVGPIFVVSDLGSRNGVFLDGERIDEAPLSLGSVLRLGDWIGVFVKAVPRLDTAVFAEFIPGLFGGPVLRPIVELAHGGAASNLPIILEGETGTGKELFARAIHIWSARSGPFRAVNCAALPEGLAEAELFGYRKGAFTGADRTSLGHFRAAAGGTLLLDEIVDMPLTLQAKVLRALEHHEILPLGETRPVPVDVRVIAAAQSPLSQAVAERRFRSDLLARLDGLRIRLPPLRERLEEIPWVFQRLLDQHSGRRAPAIEARLIEQLCLYDWPFNVRELDLLVRRLLAFHGHEPLLKRSHLPAHLGRWLPRAEHSLAREAVVTSPEAYSAKKPDVAPSVNREATQQQRDTRDLEALIDALRASHGNVAQAAAAVGVSRQRAYRLMSGSAEVRLDELRAECAPGIAEPNVLAVTSDPRSAK
jgi:DNA-binding NtrC family response regulator